MPMGLVPDWSVVAMVAVVPVRPGRMSWVAVGVRYTGSSIDGTTVRVIGLPLIEAVKSETPEKTKPEGLMVTVPVAIE